MTQPPPSESPRFGDTSGNRPYGPPATPGFGSGRSYGQQWAQYPNSPGLRPLVDDPFGPDAPLPDASPADALVRFWRRALMFSGRASRSEYWWGNALSVGIVYTVAAAAHLTAGTTGLAFLSGPLLLLAVLYALAASLPSLSVLVRRLHDSSSSGLLALFCLLPYAGTIILLIFTLLASRPEGALFDRINRR